MEVLKFMKLIFEFITTVSTACVVIVHVFEKKPLKRFFFKILPLFFCGTLNSENKKVRGFRALKAEKEQYERTQNMIKSIISDCNYENSFILNREELLNFLQDSNILKKIQIRK